MDDLYDGLSTNIYPSLQVIRSRRRTSWNIESSSRDQLTLGRLDRRVAGGDVAGRTDWRIRRGLIEYIKISISSLKQIPNGMKTIECLRHRFSSGNQTALCTNIPPEPTMIIRSGSCWKKCGCGTREAASEVTALIFWSSLGREGSFQEPIGRKLTKKWIHGE